MTYCTYDSGVGDSRCFIFQDISNLKVSYDSVSLSEHAGVFILAIHPFSRVLRSLVGPNLYSIFSPLSFLFSGSLNFLELFESAASKRLKNGT